MPAAAGSASTGPARRAWDTVADTDGRDVEAALAELERDGLVRFNGTHWQITDAGRAALAAERAARTRQS